MVSENKFYNVSPVYVYALCVHACVGQFQNHLAQSFFLRSSSAIYNICSGRLKVKVIYECQMIKWL